MLAYMASVIIHDELKLECPALADRWSLAYIAETCHGVQPTALASLGRIAADNGCRYVIAQCTYHRMCELAAVQQHRWPAWRLLSTIENQD